MLHNGNVYLRFELQIAIKACLFGALRRQRLDWLLEIGVRSNLPQVPCSAIDLLILCLSLPTLRSSLANFLGLCRQVENLAGIVLEFWAHKQSQQISGNFCKKSRLQRQLLPSSLGALDATSKVSFPLWETEARQHRRNKNCATDVCLSCSCCPWAGADSFPGHRRLSSYSLPRALPDSFASHLGGVSQKRCLLDSIRATGIDNSKDVSTLLHGQKVFGKDSQSSRKEVPMSSLRSVQSESGDRECQVRGSSSLQMSCISLDWIGRTSFFQHFH